TYDAPTRGRISPTLPEDGVFDPAVLELAVLGRVRCARPRVAVAPRGEAIGGDAAADERVPHGIGTRLGERHVGGRIARVVGIAADLHPGSCRHRIDGARRSPEPGPAVRWRL